MSLFVDFFGYNNISDESKARFICRISRNKEYSYSTKFLLLLQEVKYARKNSIARRTIYNRTISFR